MPKPLTAVLAQIEKGNTPRVLLIGGTSDFLSEQAFHQVRDAIAAKSPSIALETYEPGTELASILDSYRTDVALRRRASADRARSERLRFGERDRVAV